MSCRKYCGRVYTMEQSFLPPLRQINFSSIYIIVIVPLKKPTLFHANGWKLVRNVMNTNTRGTTTTKLNHITVLPSASIVHIPPAAPCKTLRGGPCVADSAAAVSVAAAAVGGGAELQPAGMPGAAGESCAPPAVGSAWPPPCQCLALPAWRHSPRPAVGRPTHSSVSGGPLFSFYFNPFAALACKSSGLKDARTRLQTVFFWSYNASTFKVYAFW